MFPTKAVGLVLAGILGGMAVGGPAGVGAAHLGSRLAESPLGKLVSGNLGRWLVLRSELNVSDEQKAQIRETLVSHKPEIARAAKGVWAQRTALREAVLSGQDEAAVRKAADELGKSIGDAAVLAAKVVGQLKPILTEQQRQQIKATRADCDQAVERFLTQAAQAQ